MSTKEREELKRVKSAWKKQGGNPTGLFHQVIAEKGYWWKKGNPYRASHVPRHDRKIAVRCKLDAL